jgi:hypothetical protein
MGDMTRIRSHLTYANVMATIAVFIALGGGAYAAFHLPKDSVKSKHIVDGQVKPHDLGIPATFTDVGLPDVLGNCDPEYGWGDLSPNINNPVGYHRDPQGFVQLRGVAIKCNSAGNTVFTLPAGFRPDRQQVMVASFSTGSGRVNIDPSGAVAPDVVVPANTWVSLDGMRFRCAPSGPDGCP